MGSEWVNGQETHDYVYLRHTVQMDVVILDFVSSLGIWVPQNEDAVTLVSMIKWIHLEYQDKTKASIVMVGIKRFEPGSIVVFVIP